MSPNVSAGAETSAGRRWVEQYLFPLLRGRHPGYGRRPLKCLQIEPDDEDEAVRIRADGHECDVLVSNPNLLGRGDWSQPPLLGTAADTALESTAYDLITAGRLGRFATNRSLWKAVAHELARLCRPGGVLLVVAGNRRCPVDLTGNASRMYGRGCPSLVSMGEMEAGFVGEGRFSSMQPLPISRHFGWDRLGALARPLGRVLETYFRLVADPRRRWLYESPLNPVFILWLQK